MMPSNEERQERGAALIDGWKRVGTGEESASGVVEAYLESGAGDEYDMRSNYVDMLADIGHWLAADGDLQDFDDACRIAKSLPGPAPEGEEDVVLAAWAISRVRTEIAGIGEDPDQAVDMARMHVESEIEEHDGDSVDDDEDAGYAL